MMRVVDLSLDVYTPAAIMKSLKSFQGTLDATVETLADSALLRVDGDARVIDEFLNYALTLSAQERLS